MKTIRTNILLTLFLLIVSFGCDSQSGITDANLKKNSGGPSGTTTQIFDLPEFFLYSVIGGEEVTLNGSPIWIKESFIPSLNSDVHSNTTVKLNGKKITVEGFVTYVDNIIIDGDEISIVPNSNPNNDPVHYQVPGIAIPHINVEDYKWMADIVYDEDTQLSGNIELGTQSDPYIIYISGNLYLDAVIFNGYGIVLAEKEIEIVSDVINSSSNTDHSKVLIVGGDKFKVNNSSTALHAAVYSKYEIDVNGENILIEGSLATTRKNTLNGNGIKLKYNPVYSELSDLIFGSRK